MKFELPQPLAVLDLTMSDGALVRVRRHGNAAGPRLLLSHGNGFAIDGYFPFWRRFLGDFDVCVYDQRNHGWNTRHLAAGHTQQQMADDLQSIRMAIDAQFGIARTTGIFHSLSTTVSLLHILQHGYLWDDLILLDPPLAPPPGHPLHVIARDFELTLSRWARQRQEMFASEQELAAHFRAARRMHAWVPGAADLMARAVTRPAPEGGVRLVCPGEFESNIYLQNADAQGWSIVSEMRPELLIISSDYDAPDAEPPGLVSKALKEQFGIKVVAVPKTGHLLQIELPGQVERIVREHLNARGLVAR